LGIEVHVPQEKLEEGEGKGMGMYFFSSKWLPQREKGGSEPLSERDMT